MGREYTYFSNDRAKKYAKTAIDFGANIVILHPHTVQEIELYKGKFIFYSLGNHIFPTKLHMSLEGLIVKIDLVKDDNNRIKDYIKL